VVLLLLLENCKKMAFEFLISPKRYFEKPYLIFFLSLLISTVSIILSYNLLEKLSSIVIITFTILPLVPIIMKIFEEEDFEVEKLSNIFGTKRVLKIYAWIFLGLIVSFSFWYTFLPGDVSKRVFSEQIEQYYDMGYGEEENKYQFNYEGIKQRTEKCDAVVLNDLMLEYNFDIINCEVILPESVQNKAYLIYLGSSTRFADLIYKVQTGVVYPYKEFLRSVIMGVNLKLLLFIFLTSFIFGAGSLFIISWNASIIGVYIGEITLKYYSMVDNAPFAKFFSYVIGFFYSVGRIFFHGILEFGGFFIAAIAGGLISIAIFKNNFDLKIFKKMAFRSIVLFVFSAFLIIMAAYVETI